MLGTNNKTGKSSPVDYAVTIRRKKREKGNSLPGSSYTLGDEEGGRKLGTLLYKGTKGERGDASSYVWTHGKLPSRGFPKAGGRCNIHEQGSINPKREGETVKIQGIEQQHKGGVGKRKRGHNERKKGGGDLPGR